MNEYLNISVYDERFVEKEAEIVNQSEAVLFCWAGLPPIATKVSSAVSSLW